MALKPCRSCGGPKPPGKGKRMCETCSAERPCSRCGVPISSKHELRRAKCNECHATEQSARNKKLSEHYYAKKSLHRYGLTETELDNLLAIESCEVCGGKPSEKTGPGQKLHIDHCHKTGKVRGRLCAPCNRALGHVKDSPERLEALAKYLRERGG